MSQTRNDSEATRKASQDFDAQMKVARQVMKEERVVLRALALGDQHPEADVATLIEMAEGQLRSEGRIA